jgi:hypothetical protein
MDSLPADMKLLSVLIHHVIMLLTISPPSLHTASDVLKQEKLEWAAASSMNMCQAK